MRQATNYQTSETPSVLAALRALLPNRLLLMGEARRLAELQANRLLSLRSVTTAPVPTEIATDLPGITVDYDLDMPASGASDWDSHHRRWVITLCASEPDTRHRVTLLHEYKHIIDYGHPGIAQPTSGYRGRPPAEVVADYFAGCVLMPKRLVKAAYYSGTQRLTDLAELFDVSQAAMQVRLNQLGLTDPTTRCAPGTTREQTQTSRPGHYQRAFSTGAQITARSAEVAA